MLQRKLKNVVEGNISEVKILLLNRDVFLCKESDLNAFKMQLLMHRYEQRFGEINCIQSSLFISHQPL